jgi:hypothetical protein
MGRNGGVTNSRQVCGEINPALGPHSTCIRKTAHKHHCDNAGRQWPNTNNNKVLPSTVRDDQLQELLMYCKSQDGRYQTAKDAYRDVAHKLGMILDRKS